MAYDYDITVKMDALVSRTPDIVRFDSVKPVQVDSCTFVPARTIAEAAGMEVEWDQSTQTALLTLYANAYSEKPIERYAAELIDKVGGYGLELQPTSITAALKLYDMNAVIRYNFTDTDGDTVAIGKTVKMDSAAQMVNDASLMIPLRSAMQLFGLDVEWNQEDLTAKISIPEDIFVPSGLKIIANHTPAEEKESSNSSIDIGSLIPYDEYIASLEGSYTEQVVEEDSPVNDDPQLGTYIGRFKITHYCPCSICNGGWGAYTAWAGAIIPGQTIAVDPSVIGKLSWVYIEDYGLRRAEDCGGGVQGYHIDMAVATHAEAMSKGVVYKDVYYAE
jgi:3D (Asp-Asp-Asp) domain-containing protein